MEMNKQNGLADALLAGVRSKESFLLDVNCFYNALSAVKTLFSFGRKMHRARACGVKSIILALENIFSGKKLVAALANKNIAGVGPLARKKLDSQAF